MKYNNLLKNRFLHWPILSLYAARKLHRAERLLREKDYYSSMAICCRLLRLIKHRRDMKVAVSGIVVRKAENIYKAIMDKCVFRNGKLQDIDSNLLYRQRRSDEHATRLRKMFYDRDTDKSAFSTYLRISFANNLLPYHDVIAVTKKYNGETGEKGIMYLDGAHVIEDFPIFYDLRKIMSRYYLVFQSSWWGAMDPAYFQYICNNNNILYLVGEKIDYDYLKELKSNIVPFKGGHNFTDDKTFVDMRRPKTYDFILVCGYLPDKNGDEFLRAFSRALKVKPNMTALIVSTVYEVEQKNKELVGKMGLLKKIKFINNVSHEKMAELYSSSKAYVQLSSVEGANKGVAEALSCGTPVLIYKYNTGIDKEDVEQNNFGILTDFGKNLTDNLLKMANQHNEYRDIAEKYRDKYGAINYSMAISEMIRRIARDKKEPWTENGVPRRNKLHWTHTFDHGYYLNETDSGKMTKEYERLKECLI